MSLIRDLLTIVRYRQQPTPQRLEWTPELVARFWDGLRVNKINAFSFSKQGGKALAIAIDHLLPREGEILDFGAGGGDLVELLLERGCRMAAYEPTPAGRAALVERFRGQPAFTGALGPADERQFSAVLMIEVIEHILEPELDGALSRLSRMTAPDGVLVITTPNNEDLELGMCIDPISNTIFHRWQHVRSFTRESLVGLLDRYGFDEVVTHELELSNHIYVPFDPVWGGADPDAELPSHLKQLRANERCANGGQQNLVYVGRRRR